MKIVYTGPLSPVGQTSEMRRVTLERMGHATVPVDYMPLVRVQPRLWRQLQWRLRAGPFVTRYNQELRAALTDACDILWVDKGMFVHAKTITEAKRAGVRVVHYSPDNYFLAQNASRHLSASLPLYDLVVTTKADKLGALQAAGARAVLLSGNSYDPETHRPLPPDEVKKRAVACDVSFIGRWEPERETWLGRIAATGVKLSIRGPQWERARLPAVCRAVGAGSVLGLDYAAAIAAAKINVAFLSRLAADAITQRSVEIPACGGFMLAERTPEHLAHFREGHEAAYFEGVDEMLEKIDYYLRDEAARQRIATAGRVRCVASGYSYDARLEEILKVLQKS